MTMTHIIKTSIGATCALAAASLLAAPTLSAQDAAQWLPYVGCWQPVGEATEDAPDPLLCVVPEGAGVEMITFEDAQQIGVVSVIADGTSRSLQREGCSGTEVGHFSEDGRFLTTESQYTCEGDVSGSSSRFIAMVTPFEWVEVEIMKAEDGEFSAVRRYQLASAEDLAAVGLTELGADRAQAIRASRLAASAPATIDDVIELSGTLHPQAVQAWLVEQNVGFRVDADQLVRMADAGVPGDVIDMVVATSYPDRFAIAPTGPEEYADQADDRYRPRKYLSMGYGGFGWSRWDRWGYSPYSGYNSLYGFNSYGYTGGYGYYGYQPTIVVLRPGSGSTPAAGNRGRVVRGRGYSSGGSSNSGRSVRRADPGSSGGAAARSSGSGSSSSKGSATRKAKRRGGGL